MAEITIERTLWYEANERIELCQADLAERTEPLVILGEAGMGKSHLLEWLANSSGFARCTARQLINRHNPRTLLGDAQVLVIDALDEVGGQREGDAVDLVLRRLGELGYPRFILSCRVADWRSATGLEAIREQYPDEPLELHLEPFNDADAISFLSASLGAETANAVVAHFDARGLQGLLGNPQTLELVARVSGTGPLPETRGELFERAIDVLRVEHRNEKVGSQPSREIALAAAGATFAGLILSGCGSIVRNALANNAEGELQLSEVKSLPGGADIEVILGTRLFKAEGADRFNYWHRRIGEYLGARWLAKLADTKRKRKRLLQLFHGYGLVPASLRGIHAWLAKDPAFASAVIAADPMGVIEYGDADALTADQAILLLKALEALAAENPRFRDWGPYSLRGVAQPALVDDVRRLITAPETPFGLRLLVLQAIKGSAIAPAFADELRALVLDPSAIFANRSAAGEALVQLAAGDDWLTIVRTLHTHGDELSVRLAIELMDDVGYDTFDDSLIVDLVVAYAAGGSRTLGVLRGLEKRLPEARIDGVLDRLAETATTLGTPYERPGSQTLSEYAYQLVTRRVSSEGTDARKLWSWLQPFSEDIGYHDDAREQLATLLQQNDALRQAAQRLVLLEDTAGQGPWERSWQLRERSSGFAPTVPDVIALLDALDPSDHNDERWRDVVQLAHHDGTSGADVRAVARRFASHRHDLLQWVDKLSEVPTPEWQIKRAQREQERQETRALQQVEHRRYFTSHIDRVRRGELDFIIDPARIYLSLFADMDNEEMLPHERISQWLGTEICEAALSGFEAFLALDPPQPTADEIVAGLMESRLWYAGYVIVAALAERWRNSVGYDDLSDETLLTGLFELRHTKLDNHAGIDGLEEVIAAEVNRRGKWPDAMRRYHEPQLQARREQVDGLHALMRDEHHSLLSVEFAAEWLMRFPDLPAATEAELIDRLVRADQYDALRRASLIRSSLADTARRRNWDAVGLIADFETTARRLDASPIESELLWHVRDRARGGYRDHGGTALSAAQLEWLIKSFRSVWPVASPPGTVRVGTTNACDATEYITHLIRRLGNTSDTDAAAALARLRDAVADGYTEVIQSVAAEQTRIRIEATYVPPSLDAIEAITRDQAPLTASDLQAFMLEELSVVQAKVKSDDVESWRGFFDDRGVPFEEERCRDHLLGLLRQGSEGITLEPESHIAADKEVDIACSVGTLRMPIEVKGQWHRDLWHAADTQLDRLYVQDWRTDGRGIYLVLWFGEQTQPNKALKSPGRGTERPDSPSRLCELLASASQAAQDGRVSVFVLDLAR
jgi:hypothetical protein